MSGVDVDDKVPHIRYTVMPFSPVDGIVNSTLPVDVGGGYERVWPGGLGVFWSGMLYAIAV